MRSAISFALGLGGPISEGHSDFFISEEMHALATRIAARNACFCFVGVLPDGAQILSTDRDDLLDRGCDRIAWIARDGSAA